jgi:hypothetical protein
VADHASLCKRIQWKEIVSDKTTSMKQDSLCFRPHTRPLGCIVPETTSTNYMTVSAAEESLISSHVFVLYNFVWIFFIVLNKYSTSFITHITRHNSRFTAFKICDTTYTVQSRRIMKKTEKWWTVSLSLLTAIDLFTCSSGQAPCTGILVCLLDKCVTCVWKIDGHQIFYYWVLLCE